MNNNVHSALEGTKTHENLTDAFGGEARSAMRYLIFANAAHEQGDHGLGRIFERLSGNEAEHAELWMRYLGEVGTNMQNAESVLASEEYEKDVMYPEFARTAREEGFSEIAEKLELAANAEGNHHKILSEYIQRLHDGSMYDDDKETEWECTNCGYMHSGKSVPERCPLCSAARSVFVRGM